jgi:hypothetical protein
MSKNSQRAIAFSYKDMSVEEFDGLRAETDDFDAADTSDKLATD